MPKKRFERVKPGARNAQAFAVRRLDAMLGTIDGAESALTECNRDFARCGLRYARAISRYEKERKRFNRVHGSGPDDEEAEASGTYFLEAATFVEQLRGILSTQLEQLQGLRKDVADQRRRTARRAPKKVKRYG